MFLRKALVIFCPLIMCAVSLAVFRWLDGITGASSFLSFALKGLILGALMALILPASGISAVNNGLVPCLYISGGLLIMLIAVQALTASGALSLGALAGLMPINGQVALTEGAALGFVTTTAVLGTAKKA